MGIVSRDVVIGQCHKPEANYQMIIWADCLVFCIIRLTMEKLQYKFDNW